jgi:hypothetical protein
VIAEPVAAADNEEDEGTSSQPQRIEYAVEEGIAGFVEIHPHTGLISIGQRFLEDSYEELRFSAAAQNPHTGKILVRYQ